MTREVSATPHCVNTLGNKFLRLGRNTQGRDRPWPTALVTQSPNFGVEKIIRPRKHRKPLFGWQTRCMGRWLAAQYTMIKKGPDMRQSARLRRFGNLGFGRHVCV